MKTIQLSERELSMIFSMMTPPYAVSDNHTDEFNELRNKVFYALRDAQNDEPVSNRDELPVIGWLRSDYNSDDKRDPNAPLFMLGSNDPTETWGEKYIPLAGKSPAIQDIWIPVSERMPDEGAYISAVSRHGEYVAGQVSDSWLDLHDGTSFSVNEVYLWMPLPPLPAAPLQEVK